MKGATAPAQPLPGRPATSMLLGVYPGPEGSAECCVPSLPGLQNSAVPTGQSDSEAHTGWHQKVGRLPGLGGTSAWNALPRRPGPFAAHTLIWRLSLAASLRFHGRLH